MFDITTLTNAAAIALGLAAWTVLIRTLAGEDPADLSALFGRPWEPAWPRGVQEEEPFHWHVQRLDRRSPAGAADAPRPLRGLPACDDCADEAAA